MNIKIADFGFSRQISSKTNSSAINTKKIEYNSIDNIGTYNHIINIYRYIIIIT